MKTIRIGNHLIGHGQPAVITAELGINGNGSVEQMTSLIKLAHEAGAAGVKLQKRTIPVVYEQVLNEPRSVPADILRNAIERGALPQESVDRLLASDFKQTTNGDLKYALEFSEAEYRKMCSYAQSLGLFVFASPWDVDSVDFLEKFDVPCHKIASPCLTNVALLERVKMTGKPVILAVGMSNMDQIRMAVSILGTENLIILQAVSEYPPIDSHINLNVIHTLSREFPGVPIGYSGHEKDIDPSIWAVANGAKVIERHFTLNREGWGSDQKASIEPHELEEMIKKIRRLEDVLGDGKKVVYPEEIPHQKKLRRVDDLIPDATASCV